MIELSMVLIFETQQFLPLNLNTFSGDVDGHVTKNPSLSVTRKSFINSTDFFVIGYTVFSRKSLSKVYS